MDFQSAMETFAEAWVAANAGAQTQALALTRPKSELALSLQNDSTSTSLMPSTLPGNGAVGSSVDGGRIGSASSSASSRDDRSPKQISKHQHQHQPQHPSSTPINIAESPSTASQSHTNGATAAAAAAAAAAAVASAAGSPLAVNLKLNAAISTATSPLIENGNGASGGNPNVFLPSTAASPSDLRKEYDVTKVNAKSLPLHCIVESITSMQASLCMENRSLWKRRPNIETDSYVIVPAVTPFSDILSTALQRLGYSSDIASTARGSIIIKNWKPLPMEKIADSPLVSVGDILGELTSVVTLRIVILRTKPSAFTEIKDKLLKLLILQSHAVLRSAGCPLDEMTLSQICRTNYQSPFPYSTEISDETFRNFDQWWSNQLTPQSNAATPKLLPFLNAQKTNAADIQAAADFAMLGNRNLHTSRESLIENHKQAGLNQSQHHHHNFIVHPALQTVHSQYPNQKTRMRTSFDPEMELPKLQRWFQENPHPSRQQIQSYVLQLNSLDSRRGRKPLDVNNVVYWFKNARAAQKRAELRGQGLSNGFSNVNQNDSIHAHNREYNLKSPQSIKSDEMDNMSQHSDDMEEDMERPSSPQLPLSLTTHERHRSTSSIEGSPIKVEPEFHERPSSRNNNNISQAINNNNNSSNNNSVGDNNNGTDRFNDTHNESAVVDGNRVDDENNDVVSIKSQRHSSIKDSPQSEEDLDMEGSDINPMEEFRSPSPSFPILPNSMFSHSIMYMSHYIPQMNQGAVAGGLLPNTSPNALAQNNVCGMNLSNDERRKRNRTFIDPVTEVPKLEQWFAMNTHPSHNLILKYTEDLNRMPYRQKFPRLESKNVQFWFKNRRAKCKRLKMSLYDSPHIPDLGPFAHSLKRE